ncbi:MAG: tRNA (adenosine(37)-N6)-dimethylallyltransferase MiaA, partial [Chthoniobacterales bacterium]
SITLAERLDAEIVGADAFQIYQEIPILTAQPTAAERDLIRHHCVGFVPVASGFDAAAYVRAAETALADIQARGKRALIVGGTGLYVRALTTGLDPTPPADPFLRSELAELSLPDLIERLRQADPMAPAMVDLANRRRVQRALEICETSGQPLAAFRTPPSPPPTNGLLLTRDRSNLYSRIDSNVETMFAANVEAEVRQLGSSDTLGPTAARTLGLREVQAVLRGEMTRPEAIATIAQSTRRYAKRQLTWFRNQTNFTTLELPPVTHPREAVEEACRLLKLA